MTVSLFQKQEISVRKLNSATKAAIAASALGGLALAGTLHAQAMMNTALWTDPAPGEYDIKPAANMCFERVSGGSIFVAPHLAIGTCDANIFHQSLELAPNSRSGAAGAGTSNLTWRIMSGNECATIARGVIFGAPRVDMHACDAPSGDRTFAGGQDQRFSLQLVAPNSVRIRTQDGRCVSAEGGTPRISAKLMIEPCDGRPGQTFGLERSGGLMTVINGAAATAFGWTQIDQTSSIFDRQFRLANMNLPSGDYAGVATANDQGAECVRLCAADVNCKGYTWVDPRNRGGIPMCYKKNVLNQPVADTMTQSGIIRPIG
jgi:hypothetical protein